MDDRLARIETQVGELKATVSSLSLRLAALESGMPASPRPATRDDITEEIAALAPKRTTLVEGVALSGRALVVLGGAYLLRAVTDSGAFTRPVGIALGVLYAGVWVFMSHRAASRKRDLSAAFHGLAASAIGFPVVWEATLRFEVLPHPVSALLLTIFAAGGFAVAWHRRLGGLAWVVALFSLGTGIGLLFRSHTIAPYAAHLLVLSGALLWLTYERQWVGLRWVSGLAIDFALVLLVLLVVGPRQPDWAEPGLIAGVLLAFATLYGGAFVGRSLWGRRRLYVFEVVQTGIVAVVCYGGAIAVLGPGAGAFALGLLACALGAVAYATSWTGLRGRAEQPVAFWYYSSLGVALVLGGVMVAVPLPWAALVLGVLGASVAWAAPRLDPQVTGAHAAIFALAAVARSGLFETCGGAFVVGVGEAAWRLDLVGCLVLLTSAVALGALARPAAPDGRRAGAWARLLLICAVAIGVSGGLVGLLADPVASAGSADGDVGVLTALRTAVLAVTAVGLAFAGRSALLREAGWLVYPVLGLAGLKFLLQDVPQGRPATLFASLVLYGGALIAVPLLRRVES